LSRVFVDTSALYAVLVGTDENHREAVRTLKRLAAAERPLLTTSYVLSEAVSLLAARVGLAAVAAFRESFGPLLEVVWVGPDLHEAGVDLLLERKRRRLSLVDCVSFAAMREKRIDTFFAFDRHFRDEGFAPEG
jgi:predicted nucleic acid-binding protein